MMRTKPIYTPTLRLMFGLCAMGIGIDPSATHVAKAAGETAAMGEPDPRWIDYLRGKKLLEEVDGKTVAMVNVYFDPSRIEPGVPLGTDFGVFAGEALRAAFPPDSDVDISRLLSPDARETLRKQFALDPQLLGATVRIGVPINLPARQRERP